MNQKPAGTQDRPAELLQTLAAMLRELKTGWDANGATLRPEMYLGRDLALNSLDFVRLGAMLKKKFKNATIPFQYLFVNEAGEIVSDIQVSRFISFIEKYAG